MQELYDNLMALVDLETKTKFFYKDFVSPFGKTYRIFSYQFVSYEDWLKPSALECRGIMFEIQDDKPVQIVVRPQTKFFNLGENPLTMNINYTETPIVEVLNKADGSLVSSYVEEGMLFFKSKCSIYSEQADAANQFVQDYDNNDLKTRLIQLYHDGFTANFEYVDISNRIVLIYEKRNLILLNIRDRETGEYVPYSEIYKDPILRPYLVERLNSPSPEDTTDWVENVQQDVNIEGYVFTLSDGRIIKLKTEWYIALHATKSSIESDKNLFEAITNSSADDLKSLFSDEYSINKINKFESVYFDYLNNSINTINTLTKKLAGSDRKTYAIQAQSELVNSGQIYLFGIVMQSFDSQIELEDLTKKLTTIFNKNYKLFVPEV